ncbi:hypothetical protein GCM10023083_65100 [Streptomyces phyllanthi]
MPSTVNAYRFGRFPPPFASAACALGATAAPVSATPAPVTADFFRNFRRFNGMTGTPRGGTQGRKAGPDRGPDPWAGALSPKPGPETWTRYNNARR